MVTNEYSDQEMADNCTVGICLSSAMLIKGGGEIIW